MAIGGFVTQGIGGGATATQHLLLGFGVGQGPAVRYIRGTGLDLPTLRGRALDLPTLRGTGADLPTLRGRGLD